MSDEVYAKTLTAVIRILGVFALLACPMAFLGALIEPDLQIPFIVAGIVLVLIGVGCLRGTAITAEQIDRLRKR
jgi:cytochrome c biogenesis protein CcdA